MFDSTEQKTQIGSRQSADSCNATTVRVGHGQIELLGASAKGRPDRTESNAVAKAAVEIKLREHATLNPVRLDHTTYTLVGSAS